MQFTTCDEELLACIAHTFKFDARFQNYFNQYGKEDFPDFLYRAIKHNLNRHMNEPLAESFGQHSIQPMRTSPDPTGSFPLRPS